MWLNEDIGAHEHGQKEIMGPWEMCPYMAYNGTYGNTIGWGIRISCTPSNGLLAKGERTSSAFFFISFFHRNRKLITSTSTNKRVAKQKNWIRSNLNGNISCETNKSEQNSYEIKVMWEINN